MIEPRFYLIVGNYRAAMDWAWAAGVAARDIIHVTGLDSVRGYRSDSVRKVLVLHGAQIGPELYEVLYRVERDIWRREHAARVAADVMWQLLAD